MTDEPKQDESQPATAEDPKVSQSLSDEIDAGVEEAMEVVEAERNDHKPEDNSGDSKDVPSSKDQDDDEDSGGDAPDDGDSGDETEDEPALDDGQGEDQVSDELLERAVKAGLSMAEAKKFPTGSMLAHVCDKLEDSPQDSSESDDGADDGSAVENDMLASIPDLDPEVYDENVVAGFKALKEIVRQQQETISGLQEGSKSNKESWFDSKVSGLGDAFEKALNDAPEKREALQEQVEVLTAGYKAAGKEVSQETVFDQAVAITLPDVKEKAAKATKSAKLGKRKSQHISRPGGVKNEPTNDAYEDVAAELDRKFFK